MEKKKLKVPNYWIMKPG
jgi:hypothetical protein